VGRERERRRDMVMGSGRAVGQWGNIKDAQHTHTHIKGIIKERHATLTPSRAAVLPKNVSAPVASTVPSTSPLTTVDPILQLLPWNLVTGRDSPVRAASSTYSSIVYSI
jgi:hypothetical protein